MSVWVCVWMLRFRLNVSREHIMCYNVFCVNGFINPNLIEMRFAGSNELPYSLLKWWNGSVFNQNGSPSSKKTLSAKTTHTKKRGAIANILIISGSQAHFTPLELYNSFIWKQNENAIINHYKSEISHLKIGEVTIYQVIYTGSTIFMLVSKNQTFHKSIKRACSWNFNANQVIKLTHTHGHILTHAECARGKSEQTSKSEKIRYSIIVCASGMMLVICCRQLETVPATATRESEWCRRNIIESI